MGDLNSKFQRLRQVLVARDELPSDVNKVELHCRYRPAKASMTRSICCVSRGRPTSISSFRRATSSGSLTKLNCPTYVLSASTWKESTLLRESLGTKKITGKQMIAPGSEDPSDFCLADSCLKPSQVNFRRFSVC